MNATNNQVVFDHSSGIKKIAPLIPYFTIGIGLIILHNAWIAIISYHALMLIVMLISSPSVCIKQLWGNGSYKVPIITASVGLIGGVLFYLLRNYYSLPVDIDVYAESIGLTQASWPFFIIYFVIVNPFVEELFWRSYLGSRSGKVIINDLLFSGYHLLVLALKINIVWLIVVFLFLVLAAWFWRQTNRIFGGLMPSFVSHSAADLTVILALYFMIKNI